MLVFGVHEYVYTIDVSVDLPAGTYWLEVYNNTVGNPASWFWEAGTLHTLVGIPGNAISYSLPESWSTRAGEAAFEITCGAENPGDCDGDHDVDINDFDVFAVCMAGPDHWLNSGCMCAALDTDGDVDLRDFALLQTSFTGGPPLPAGACCLTDASCIMVTQHVCGLVLAGVYQGDGSDCSAPCPTGACCITQDGSCPLITEAECIAAGGTYQGNDVPCPTNPPCPYGRYSNTIVPMSSITTAGAGLQLADDLTLAGVGARDLVYLDLRVHGNGGGVFNVTVELYSDCPGNGGTPIPGATFTWNGAPDGGVCELVADPVDPPVTIPDTVWMVATFSTPQAGWVIAGPAEIGFTANLFGKNNPPWVCDWWFGGNPYAGLWANLRCVAAGGKSHGEATRLSITKVETGGADFGLRSSNSEMPEPTDGPAVLHEAQPARANTSPLNNPNWR